MNRAAILLALDELVEIPAGTLKGSESTKEWDSIVIIGLIAFADESFNKSLTVNQIVAANTVDDIIDLLVK